MSTFLKHLSLIPDYRNILIICLLWLGLSFQVHAEVIGTEPLPRSALIISNSQYEVGKLKHSLNDDAKSLAKALEDKGFKVILKTNLDDKKMDEAISNFRDEELNKGGTGLFYFSGYGRQVYGKNYLLPINNASIKQEFDIKHDTISLDEILDKMQDSNLKIIILDVSPDTPYLKPHYKSKSKIISQPKAPGANKVPDGTIISHAITSDSTMFCPGLYTKLLIKGIEIGGRIGDILRGVSNAVKRESNGKQISSPPLTVSLEKLFCLGDCTTEFKEEDLSLTKPDERQAEQKLKLNDLEKKFIIWALKRHFRNWEYPIPTSPKIDNAIRDKLEQFSCEHGLLPSRFVSSAVIDKLKEINGFSILPQYEEVGVFHKGVTAAKLNGRWGLLDTNTKKNKWRPLNYEKLNWYPESCLAVMRNGLWGLINHKGKLVQPLRYKKIKRCLEQKCAVKLGNKWGYVDLNGKLIIQPQYHIAREFREGYAAVKKNRQWLLINHQDKVQYTFSAKKLYSPSEGLSIFQNDNNKRGFVNLSGKIVIRARFDEAKRFSEGLAAVFNGKKWGFIDSNGEIKISFNFKNVRPFSEGLAAALDASGQWGYINKNGDWIIRPRFNFAYPFANGIATVRVDNPFGKNPYRGFINKDGSFYYDPVFEDVFKFKEGLARVKLFGHWGFISQELIKKYF